MSRRYPQRPTGPASPRPRPEWVWNAVAVLRLLSSVLGCLVLVGAALAIGWFLHAAIGALGVAGLGVLVIVGALLVSWGSEKGVGR